MVLFFCFQSLFKVVLVHCVMKFHHSVDKIVILSRYLLVRARILSESESVESVNEVC